MKLADYQADPIISQSDRVDYIPPVLKVGKPVRCAQRKTIEKCRVAVANNYSGGVDKALYEDQLRVMTQLEPSDLKIFSLEVGAILQKAYVMNGISRVEMRRQTRELMGDYL